MLRVWSLSVLVTFASFVHLLLPHAAVFALPLGSVSSSSWSSGLFSRSIPASRPGSVPDPFVFPFLKVPPRYGLTTNDDVNSLERRGDPSSPCSNLDLDDLESLPGWPKLQRLVRSLYGDGEYTIEINPGGYDDALATMCVADPTIIIPTGKPNCTGGRVDIPPKNGGHEVEVQSGYMNVGNWNITHVTTAAHALFFKGTFRTPNMTTPPSGTYLNTRLYNLDTVGEFINAPFNSFSTIASNMTHETKALTHLQDRTCIATINQQRCMLPARGRIQLVATGYVWFIFKKKRAPRENPYGPKQHRFSLKLEDALRTVADRSAWIDFSGMMNTTLRTDYFDECRWNFAL